MVALEREHEGADGGKFPAVEFGGVGLPQVYRHCIIRVCFVSRTRIHQRRTGRNALIPAPRSEDWGTGEDSKRRG